MGQRPAIDEGRHEPGVAPDWSEHWSFDVSREDGTGAFVRLGLHPRGRTWYWGYVVQPERGPVVVRDHELPGPRRSLEVKGESFWCDLACESPFDHWTVGLETYGVRLDDPADAYRGEMGERLPVGLDLEWEARTPVFDQPPAPGDVTGYAQAGVVHGEILLGSEVIELEGRGDRTHSWGVHDWGAAGWHRVAFQVDDLFALHVRSEGGDASGAWWTPGEGLVVATTVEIETGADDGRSVPVRYRLDGTVIGVEVVASVPVPAGGGAPGSTSPPGPGRGWLTRALCRFETPRGTGTGWAEWLGTEAGRGRVPG